MNSRKSLLLKRHLNIPFLNWQTVASDFHEWSDHHKLFPLRCGCTDSIHLSFVLKYKNISVL